MNYFKVFLTASLIGCMSLATAAENSDSKKGSDNITDLLKSRLGGAEVGAISETPVDGLYQTTMGSKVAYLSKDGRYVLIGDMIDLQTRENLTENSRREVAKVALGNFNVEDLSVFPASGQAKAVLNVFTDTSCGYCRKLHEEVPQLQKAGIEVRYFPFPRGGSQGPGYDTLRQVWCGEDRALTMSIAKGVKEGTLPEGNCEASNVVDRGYLLGNDLGVAGTPALFTQSGQKIEGYVPYAKLIPQLLNDAN